MPTNLVVDLPVKNLNKSRSLFEAQGYLCAMQPSKLQRRIGWGLSGVIGVIPHRCLMTHIRIGDPLFNVILPAIVGVIMWLGLAL